jgi:hypothetical protein
MGFYVGEFNFENNKIYDVSIDKGKLKNNKNPNYSYKGCTLIKSIYRKGCSIIDDINSSIMDCYNDIKKLRWRTSLLTWVIYLIIHNSKIKYNLFHPKEKLDMFEFITHNFIK